VPNLAFDEDRCRIRKQAGAQVVPSPRKLALSLLRLIFELIGLS
jgi:predicted transposase YbfD/YdcC